MEYFPITKTESGFHVENVPDAVKLIRLDDSKSRRLADLTLHKADLEFADNCLIGINGVPKDTRVVREALWRCAITHYIKCFGDSRVRFRLSADRIYKGEPPEALEVFQYFRALRNKHVVHDENPYSQSIPCAAVNKGNKPYKIEKVLCFAAHVDVLGQDNYSNLKLLIDKALAWVVSEFDTCCSAVTKELEKQSHEELLQRDEVTYSKPTVEDMSRNRRKKT